MSINPRPFAVRPKAGSRYRKLPVVGPILDNLLVWLRRRGYCEWTIRNILARTARICRWLQRRCGQELSSLSQSDLTAASAHFGKQRIEVAGTCRLLSIFLGEQQLLHAEQPKPPSHTNCQLQSFRTYLREVRGLAPMTVLGHCRRISAFLEFLKIEEHPAAIGMLGLEQIEEFLCQTAKTNNRFSMQQVVGSLRIFLRQQHAQGILPKALHQQIDTPRVYRLERLPRALPWEQIIELLHSIDCSTSGGLRDFTLLHLAASYGLRGCELVRLTLDDIDWQTRTLKIRQTKTKQTLLLPLSKESLAVLARFLREGRRCSTGCRELFLRHHAPAGPLAATALHDILERRIVLSGLKIPSLGGHALRHSLAVHLLHQGEGLPTIGAALGHRNCESTAIYLRLAFDDLREVGLPVPQGGKAMVPEQSGWHKRLVPVRENKCLKRLNPTEFRSGLAESMRRYLQTRRALGRSCRVEEAILRRWDDFLLRHFPKASEVKLPMFQRWAQTMQNLAATTRRQRMHIVRNFLIFHARQNPRTSIPDLKTFPKPGPLRVLPRLVSTKEMAHLLASASMLPPSPRNPLRAQTVRLALILLFCCGLRRGELLKLKIEHFDVQSKILRVEATKFHKSRLLPLPDTVTQELQNYLALRRDLQRALPPDAPLLSSNHRLAEQTTYCVHALTESWQLLCLTTGVLNDRRHPPRLHDLRHSFAVAALDRWYQQGIDVQSKLSHLATYLGHVSIVSTYYYLQLSPELGQSASQRFHHYAKPLFTR
jgi:integrase/recombinase XerD